MRRLRPALVLAFFGVVVPLVVHPSGPASALPTPIVGPPSWAQPSIPACLSKTPDLHVNLYENWPQNTTSTDSDDAAYADRSDLCLYYVAEVVYHVTASTPTYKRFARTKTWMVHTVSEGTELNTKEKCESSEVEAYLYRGPDFIQHLRVYGDWDAVSGTCGRSDGREVPNQILMDEVDLAEGQTTFRLLLKRELVGAPARVDGAANFGISG